MKKYRLKETQELYNNNRRAYPFQITETFRSAFPIQKDADLSCVSLFFATYQQTCLGRLEIVLKCDKVRMVYDIDMRDVKDNQALRLEVAKKCPVSKSVAFEIRAEYAAQNPIALWVNELGTCAVVEGAVFEEFVLKNQPLISVLVPVYNCSAAVLKECIESIKKQIYKEWELCIVDDGSTDSCVLSYLKKLSELKGEKINVQFSKKNQGIAAASNRALRMALGEYVCFVDNDDLLHELALMEIVRVLNKDPDVDLIYTDEDKVSEGGMHFDPFYKPDWNYPMLLSQNYICHLIAYRRKALNKINGFRHGYEGSQDYDLLLRYLEEIIVKGNEPRVKHIPKVLYHWRTVRGSTATGIGHKAAARVNGERAIANHIASTDFSGCVSMGFCPGTYKVDLDIKRNPDVCIIIPFKNKVDYLKSLLYTIKRSTYLNYRVLLVDNGSDRRQIKELEKDSGPLWIEQYKKPFSFSAINNYAVGLAKDYELLLFLNNDTEVMNPDWLEAMVQHFERIEVGAVGAKLLYPDHRIQHAGVIIGMGGIAGHSHKYVPEGSPGYFSRPHLIQEVSAVTGACLMTTRHDFEAVGGFEEKLPKAFNDVDYCLKLRRKGQKIIYTPYARLLHYESLSRGIDNHQDADFQHAVRYMEEKWGCRKYNDPYYNPNLTLEREDFSYRAM